MKRFRRTSLVALFCGAILGGIGLSQKIYFLPPWQLWVVLSPLALQLKKKNLLSLYLLVSVGLLIGLARGSVYVDKSGQINQLAQQKVTIVGTASADAAYGVNQQLVFNMSSISLSSGQYLAGNFQVSGFGENMVYRGDRVEVSGKLYPGNGSHQAYISYATLNTIGKSTSLINNLSRRFSTGMENALPEPQASFGLGLLVGQRTNLPKSVIRDLTAVGLIHVVAVSGYNVTILARAVARLRLRSRYQKLMLSLGLIAMFIAITGFSASIVRAGVVSTLSLLAWYYGREVRPIVLIAFTAALTGFINPFYVFGDLSWYLSFLAFFGVMIVAPLIQKRFFKKEFKMARQVLLETLSAELMTLPLILVYFSQLSLVAPIANLLVVPLVPIAMLVSAIAGIVGMIAPAIAGWFAWPAEVLLTYMLDIAHILADLPIAFVKVTAGSGVMALFYTVVALVGVSVRRAIHRLTAATH